MKARIDNINRFDGPDWLMVFSAVMFAALYFAGISDLFSLPYAI